ncbi:MAG: PEP-CTERM sorting domain-containing protein [Gemmataceae bacterium]
MSQYTLSAITSANSGATLGVSNNATGGTTGTTLSSGYTGASGQFYYGLGVQEGSLNVSTSSYISVTVTPATGFAVQLNDFDFGVRSTTQGATNYELRTSLGTTPFGTTIASGTINDAAAAWAYNNNTFTAVSGAINQSVEIRLYFWDSTAGTIGNPDTQIDDVAIVFTAVPEPTSLIGLASVVIFGVALRRKRIKSIL